MTTPICDFVENYGERSCVRLHMPGHKGVGPLGFEALDITEITGADVLYSASGIIKKSEENATKIFGTKATLYSTEGSSLSIRASVYLLKLYAAEKGEKPLILAGRNAHKVFVNSCALLDVQVNWLFPENESYLSCLVSAERLKSELEKLPEKPTAVYITSPDYLGNISDIKGVCEVCHANDILLFVDNAHGAYLNFLPENEHPIFLGADVCCDSAHKTLPALTGGGYLHISKSAPDFFAANAQKALSLFASTSPSYLILQSLDKVNAYLDGGFRAELSAFIKEVEDFKGELISHGYELSGNEKLKVTLMPKPFGYTGTELGQVLEKSGIYPEFADPDHLVLMLSPQNSPRDIEQTKKVLLSLKRCEPLQSCPPKMTAPKQKMSPHEALFAPSREEYTQNCLGKILASAEVSCPPAVPIVSLGEEIDEAAISAFEYYSIRKLCVVEIMN